MTIVEINQALGPVYNTLGQISVSGYENCGRLYAAMDTIKHIIGETYEQIRKEQESAEANE